MAAQKNVDLPVFGFPTTPSNRVYDRCIEVSLLIVALCYAILVALGEENRLDWFWILIGGALRFLRWLYVWS